MSVPIADQIKELEREMGMRRRMYPQWVERGTLTKEKATKQLDAMGAALKTLQKLQQEQNHPRLAV